MKGRGPRLRGGSRDREASSADRVVVALRLWVGRPDVGVEERHERETRRPTPRDHGGGVGEGSDEGERETMGPGSTPVTGQAGHL